MNSIIVLNPTTDATVSEVKLAPRLTSLEGNVLGILNNKKRNSDVFLQHILNFIKTKYNLKGVVWLDKDHASLPMSDNILEQLKSCHAVITGVGD